MKFIKFLPFIILLVMFWLCGSNNNVQPRMQMPGFDTKLIFRDDFDNSVLENWKKEGIGDITVSSNGKAVLSLGEESKGLALWALKEINVDFQLEFNLKIPNHNGLFIIIICAHGMNGEDIINDLPERNGELEEYSKENIRSYHISSHCFTAQGEQIPGSKLRKNPGHLLLSRNAVDPCISSRTYYIDVVKTGNRIRYYVDDMLIHDVRDKGGFGPIYSKGKLGFWIGGNPEDFQVILDDIRIFRLKVK